MNQPVELAAEAPSLHTKILVIDDESMIRSVLKRLIRRRGHEVIEASTGEEGKCALQQAHPHVLFCDINLPDISGLDILTYTRETYPNIPVILITGFESANSVIQALRAGAFDYISKPFQPDYVLHRLDQAVQRVLLHQELEALREQIHIAGEDSQLIGNSPPMRRLKKLIARVAQNDIPTLITGETGTGKELVAREIHRHSSRKRSPFVPINCGALAESVLESEVFGYRKGAFTGATKDKKGLFEAAEGGTIFLDEIGETPSALQVKLLRVLQEREILPVGATSPVPINVRVIAATNRDLNTEVREGRFREDLLYRLNVIPVKIPPLRERREDIPVLATHFLDAATESYTTEARSFDIDTLYQLMGYDWPGNVRQLQNIVTRCVALAEGSVIQSEQLPDEILDVTHPVTRDLAAGLPTLQELERRHIEHVLKHTQGNKQEAATILGINRSTLYRKSKQFNIPLPNSES